MPVMKDEQLRAKRDYLAMYRLLQSKIKRLMEMIEISPERAEHYKKQLDTARKRKDGIESSIEGLKDERLAEILFQKYICAKTFEQIAYEMNYSQRQIERLHNKALFAL